MSDTTTISSAGAGSEPYWDPYDHDIRVDPYEAWRRLRDEAPVFHNERYGFYALSRFDDVLAASLDTETFSSANGITLDTIGTPSEVPMMITLDPPQHQVMRQVVSRWFTPRSIRQLEERVRELCASYLDPFVGSEGFDFVEDFGARLPVMVISSLLGFPEEDHDDLRHWSDLQVYREEGRETTTDEGAEASDKLHAYYWEAIQERRTNPRDDMVSDLLAGELEEPDGSRRQLDDLEMMAMILMINIAGNETVARHLGWLAKVYAEYPDQRRRVLDDPSLAANAVEELLRYESPSPTQARYVTQDVTLHGVTIPEGSAAALMTGSAGRDERHYGNADTFDVGRSFDRHLSLGYGIHYCLGAALARLEGRVALEETLARFPEWEVDPTEIEYVRTNTVRGPARCPIHLPT